MCSIGAVSRLCLRYAEGHRQTAEQRGEEAEANFRAAEGHRQIAEQRGEEAEANFRLAHEAVGRFYEDFAERHLKGVPGMKSARPSSTGLRQEGPVNSEIERIRPACAGSTQRAGPSVCM